MNRYQDSPEDLRPDDPDARFLGLLSVYMQHDKRIADKIGQDAADAANAQAEAKASTDGGQAKTALKRRARYNDRNSTQSVVGSSK